VNLKLVKTETLKESENNEDFKKQLPLFEYQVSFDDVNQYYRHFVLSVEVTNKKMRRKNYSVIFETFRKCVRGEI